MVPPGCPSHLGLGQYVLGHARPRPGHLESSYEVDGEMLGFAIAGIIPLKLNERV